MSDARILYAFPVLVPDVLRRERSATVSIRAVRDGKIAPITAAGSTFTLVEPGGNFAIDAQPITVTADGIAEYAIDASQLPDTLPYSELYQERWELVLPDGTTRTIRRECAVSPFLLYLPVSDSDLMDGEYPNLVDELGEQGTTLQPFIDRAYRDVLEELWKKGRWPDLMLSTSAFVKPVRELALFRIFKFLFRVTGGATGTNRWQVLMDHHDAEQKAARSDFRSRIDNDLDGLPESRTREAAGTVVHRNAHLMRTIPRSGRW